MEEDKRTIGEVLKESREKQNLSLDEVSVLTRIRVKYLTAIEADNYDLLPSSVQQKGFVRSYARALGVDPAPLINQLRPIIEEDIQEPQEPDVELNQPPLTPEAQPLGEIGSTLKSQRKRLGFTLVNVENQIYIPERYLSAIESGNLEELPSTVQGRGMVKNYAQFLGLDPEPLLLSYADVLQNRLTKVRERAPGDRAPFSFRVWLRRFFTSPTFLWVLVVMLIGGVSIWSGILIFGGKGNLGESTATIPGVADILLPSLTSTPSQEVLATSSGEIEVDVPLTTEPVEFIAEEGEPSSTPQFTGDEKVQVQLIVIQRSWVRVTVDGLVAFEGRLQPGSVKLFGGELGIEILTGNAGGVEVIFNQRDLGAMGLYGEVVSRVYTVEGIASPTPTITLTPIPTETPETTPTPQVTATSEPE
jgi:cytoskeletal protein RodZ